MDSSQTATINYDVQVSPDLHEERRGAYTEPPGTAWHGAIEAAVVDPALAARFQQLVSEWKAGTAGLSSPRAITRHPAFGQIVALGEPILPLIFRDLRDNGGWWYPALRTLTGANPVPESARGKLRLNTAAWLRWGEENGYI